VAPEKLRAGFDLVVADEYNHCIRAIAPDGSLLLLFLFFDRSFTLCVCSSGTVRTLAGDGKAGCADGRAREAQVFNLISS
jgi:hypothetical protein